MSLILLVGLGLLAMWGVAHWLGRAQRPSPNDPPDAHTWPSIGEFACQVVGESNYQPAIAQAAKEGGVLIASLVLDNENPYDDHAVRVDLLGRTVGFLSRKNARLFRRRLAERGITASTSRCHAKIFGGPLPEEPERMYGVWLDLEPLS
ncbi:HIRAN domain-containing protein [Cupriavidus gilardii]|uniref:HIRAN domain-containing protein n=1 Tax=Cupriavidus gilardii TaxID=82541 RepID=UPI0021B1C92E|nr:HIRAN domain-containing protein [Cupriavidus gilardii]UXC34810.1 HIRAN domain-containing protein [Cupriavidus gilardii]